MENSIIQLKKGRKFGSYEELQHFLEMYQQQLDNKYSVYRSKTLEAVDLHRKMKETLVFYSIHLRCYRSGIFKSKGLGIRKTNTIKKNCPAFIKVKVCADGKYLSITEFKEHHNHLLGTVGEDTLAATRPTPEDPKITIRSSGTTKDKASKKLVADDQCAIPTTEADHPELWEDKGVEENMDTLAAKKKPTPEDPKITIRSSGTIQDKPSKKLVDDDHCAIPTTEADRPKLWEDKGVEENMVLNKKDSSSIVVNDDLNGINSSAADRRKEFEDKGVAEVPKKKRSATVYSVSSSTNAVKTAVLDETESTAVHMPPITRSRGRPKGSRVTAIGLPKRTKSPVHSKSTTKEKKVRKLLTSVIPESKIAQIFCGKYKVTVSDVRSANADLIAIKTADLKILPPYFARSAFVLLKKVVMDKKSG